MWDLFQCVVAGATWFRAQFEIIEERMLAILFRHGASALRIAIGVVFVWFGALKVVGQSPAAELVTKTLSALHLAHGPFVGALGLAETAIGIALCLGVAPRSALLLFLAQQAGTLLVLVFVPAVAFQRHNPLLLTLTGEFVIKNLVLVVGGIVAMAPRLQQTTARDLSTSNLTTVRRLSSLPFRTSHV